jgi:hypothetical protein
VFIVQDKNTAAMRFHFLKCFNMTLVIPVRKVEVRTTAVVVINQ